MQHYQSGPMNSIKHTQKKPRLRERSERAWFKSPFMTSCQETEQIYSFKPETTMAPGAAAHTGAKGYEICK